MKKKITSLVCGMRLYFRFGQRLRRKGRRIFLINVPSHGNLGDHLICRAERRMIRDVFGVEPFCFSTGDTAYGLGFLQHNIRRDDLLLITGGGFLGSVWMKEELRVRSVIRMFPENRIVILPQTIFYEPTPEGDAMLREAVGIYGAHRDLTLAVRERQSYDFARNRLLPPPSAGWCLCLIWRFISILSAVVCIEMESCCVCAATRSVSPVWSFPER